MELTFLNELLNISSVSGFEHNAGNLFLNYLEPYASHIEKDVMGNSYAYIGSDENESNHVKYMIEAHIDEIGFQVIYINDKGYIYIRRNGGVDLHCIPGSQVVVQTISGEEIVGVIGKKPIHLVNNDDRNKCVELDAVWIDTGLSPDDVKSKVSIGDVVYWKPNLLYLSDKRISSKSLDNKIGVFIVSQILKRLSETKTPYPPVCGVASVQEEVGCRGAVVCGYNINPDIAICIDVDFATDVPNCPKQKFGDISLGKGVIIHRNLDNNIPLTHTVENIAKKYNIKYQISARPISTGGTNANKIQLSRAGVQTLSLGIPCRYMHTPVELCDLDDVEAAIELVYRLIIAAS